MAANRPTEDQFNIAIEWLRNNEGQEDEAEACQTVAKWLDAQAAKFIIQDAAKEAGVPVTALRRKLKENAGK